MSTASADASPASLEALQREVLPGNGALGLAVSRKRKFVRCDERFCALFGWSTS
jgi:hypothetical protein